MNDTVAMISFPLISLILGNIGAIFTMKQIPTWYKNLKKPSLNPPNWIFGPVWTILYILIGISGYLIWKDDKDPFNGKNSTAWTIYAIQLILNYLWTPLFFGAHMLFLSLIEIVLMDISIIFNIFAFYQINHIAAYLLVPYLIWVSFATYLTFGIWRLNSNPKLSHSKTA
jgi:benzodiazapine receptor